MTESLIPKHGGYRDLKSFQNAAIVYDATVAFCDRLTDRRSRTHDQMVQAARSHRCVSNRSFSSRGSESRRVCTMSSVLSGSAWSRNRLGSMTAIDAALPLNCALGP